MSTSEGGFDTTLIRLLVASPISEHSSRNIRTFVPRESSQLLRSVNRHDGRFVNVDVSSSLTSLCVDSGRTVGRGCWLSGWLSNRIEASLSRSSDPVYILKAFLPGSIVRNDPLVFLISMRAISSMKPAAGMSVGTRISNGLDHQSEYITRAQPACTRVWISSTARG